MSEGCACEKCIECCWRNPGWFGTIEEIEGASKILNLSVEDFCRSYLIREWWAGDDEHIEIPAPRRNFSRKTKEKEEWDNRRRTEIYKLWGEEMKEEIRNGPGFQRATWGHNLIDGCACIFLTDQNLCLIHKSKPKECREVFGCKPSTFDRHQLLDYWEGHQDWITAIVEGGLGEDE